MTSGAENDVDYSLVYSGLLLVNWIEQDVYVYYVSYLSQHAIFVVGSICVGFYGRMQQG